jgi:hypothetical protein
MNALPDVDGDVFVVSEIEGLDSPEVEYIAEQKDRAGAIATTVRYKERPLLIRGKAFSRPNVTFDVLRIRRKLEVASELVTAADWLYVDEPSPGIAVQMVVQRSGKLYLPKPRHNVQEFEIPLTAPDPRKYKQGSPSSAVINGGPYIITNTGNYSTYVVAVLNSTASNPGIQHDSFGMLTFLGTNLPSNSYIDFQNRRTIHAANGQQDAAARPRAWWELQPGANSIRSNASFTITWRPCWI